jgi:uncharacterized membrane protein
MNASEKEQRVRRALLVVSLLLNLFLAALAGAQYLRHRAEAARQEPVLARVLQDVTSRLDAADAETFRSVLRQEAPHYAQARENLSRAREDIDRALLAPDFDPAATREAMKRWQTAWNAFVGSFSDVLVDAMSRLSPAGRRAIVEAVPRHRPDSNP